MTVYEIQPGENLLHLNTGALQPGDVVLLRAGMHDISRWEKPFLASGTADNPIIIRGEEGAVVTRRSAVGPWIQGVSIKGRHYVIQDLIVTDCRQGGIFVYPDASHVLIERCTFLRNGHGLWLEGSDIVVRNCHAADGILTIDDSTHRDNDFGASLAMIKGRRMRFERCTASRLIQPSSDYKFDGSMYEFYPNPHVEDIEIIDCDAWAVNTFAEFGGPEGASVSRISIRNCRMYVPHDKRIPNSQIIWGGWKWGTFHIRGGGSRFGLRYDTPVNFDLEAWNIGFDDAYNGDEPVVNRSLSFKQGTLTEAEFFALREQLPLPLPDPDPPAPEPPPVPPIGTLELPESVTITIDINGQPVTFEARLVWK